MKTNHAEIYVHRNFILTLKSPILAIEFCKGEETTQKEPMHVDHLCDKNM